jgi:tetratricopeptide (TPR) repeat protein
MRHGDPQAAEPRLARACAIYPAFRTARRAWAECLLRLPSGEGWPFRALVVAAELAAQKPDDPYYRMLHANALLQVGIAADRPTAFAEAEALALSCLQIAPPKALVYRLAADCRRRLGDAAGALAHFDQALAQGLDIPALRAERSEVLRELGRVDEAERELRAAFRAAPMDPGVRAAWERRAAPSPR